MYDYESVFKELFRELKESNLEKDTKVVFKDKEGHVCVGHVIYNDNEVHWRTSHHKFCSVNIVNDKVSLLYGLTNFKYDEYNLNDLANKDDEVKTNCNYFVDATCILLNKNQEDEKTESFIDLNEINRKLKGLLQDKISIGTIGKNKNRLSGVYLPNPDEMKLNDGIDFDIVYEDNNLILYVDDKSFISSLDIACKMALVISSIVSNNILIGSPTKSFLNQRIPCFIWDLNEEKEKEYIEDFNIEYHAEPTRDEQNLSKTLSKREYLSINRKKQ